jgi:Tfp pilus assembly protein PilO
MTMRAQRVWKVNGAASIGQLQSRLDDLNKRLSQLENQHPESWRVEELRSSALSLSREIDDIRCAEATAALSELLRK